MMQRDQDRVHGKEGGPDNEPGLLAKARARTQHELDLLLSTETTHYATAALGQSPYIAMGNGVIVVQKQCGSWGC